MNQNNTILIIGESGSGKSTSIRTLDPKETFIINVLDKSLPFREGRKSYVPISANWEEGNYVSTDSANNIIKTIQFIDKKRPDIKNIILDDFQSILSNEFMRRAMEKGYEKFTELGRNAWTILNAMTSTNLFCFILTHSDTDNSGKVKCKTIGKMLDDKVCIEGMVTIVLHALIIDGHHKFLTNHEANYLAKSPMDMFPKLIDNDLALVKKYVTDYYNEDISQ